MTVAKKQKKSGSDWIALKRRIQRSAFRKRFKLAESDRAYLLARGEQIIRQHASDFVRRRLAPAHPLNDGKQTPLKGHPVFIAQHATATCCRKCMVKWHDIPEGVVLKAAQMEYVVRILMLWLKDQAPETFTVQPDVLKAP